MLGRKRTASAGDGAGSGCGSGSTLKVMICRGGARVVRPASKGIGGGDFAESESTREAGRISADNCGQEVRVCAMTSSRRSSEHWQSSGIRL